jgi:predicted transcriptional regulator
MTTTAANTRSRSWAAMTAATTTVGQYDHVAAATYLMKHAGTTALTVLDGQRSNQPIGCITETDIATAMAHGTDLNETRIRDLIVHSQAPSAPMPASQAPSCYELGWPPAEAVNLNGFLQFP